jgi:hypothetical protein
LKRLYQHQLAALALYIAIAIVLVGLPVLAHPVTAHVGLGADPSQMMWFMVWWPYALIRHLNPFISRIIWAPTGVNLTWTTSIPAVALALAPITWTFGPVISYNVAAVLAPALSAWSAFVLCRWLTGSYVAALLGGVFYGFSPYEFGHILGGHLSFTINFVPPLCLLFFGRLLDRSMTRLGFVFTFAILLIAQCLISNEVLATMTAFGALAWVVAYTLFPAQGRAVLRATLPPLTAAYLLAGVILWPFLYFALTNGNLPSRPLFPPSLFSADLVGFVIPTPLLLLAAHSFEALISQNFGNIQENEFYLGIPVLMVVGWFFWVRRTEVFAQILAVMLGVIMVAAMGPVLHIADRAASILPWAGIFDLPLLKQALPVRLANYGFLVVALVLALSLAGARPRFSAVLVAYALASYLPNVSLLLWPERYQNPPFFASGLYRQVLHQGENIVVFPYGATGPSMMWQAETGMYFSMSGAWMGPTPEEFQRWPIVNAALVGLPVSDPALQLRSFLAAHHVQAVVAAEGSAALPAALGIEPIELGGVSVYRLPQDPPISVSGQTVEELEEVAGQEWIAHLLEAASRFLDKGGDIENLNPVKLKELRLLPDSRWGRTLELVLGGASHGAITPLWIGPGSNGTVSVGLFASPSTAAVLARPYRGLATSILYPYPLPFTGVTPRYLRMEFLLITMPQGMVHAEARVLRRSIALATN